MLSRPDPSLSRVEQPQVIPTSSSGGQRPRSVAPRVCTVLLVAHGLAGVLWGSRDWLYANATNAAAIRLVRGLCGYLALVGDWYATWWVHWCAWLATAVVLAAVGRLWWLRRRLRMQLMWLLRKQGGNYLSGQRLRLRARARPSPGSVVPGSPAKAVVPVLPGTMLPEPTCEQLGTELAAAWRVGHVAVVFDPRRDVLRLRWHQQAPEVAAKYEDQLHQRLDQVLSGLGLKVTSITGQHETDQAAGGGVLRRYRVRFEPDGRWTTPGYQVQAEQRLQHLVGPDEQGRVLGMVWQPEASSVRIGYGLAPAYRDPIHARLDQLARHEPRLHINRVEPTSVLAATGVPILTTRADGVPLLLPPGTNEEETQRPATAGEGGGEAAGLESAWRVTFETNTALRNPETQRNLEHALSGMVDTGDDDRGFTAQWAPKQDQAVLRIQPALPTMITNPLIQPGHYAQVTGTSELAIPVGTYRGGELAVWEIGTNTNKPHGLYAGPTGSGKTTTARTTIKNGIDRQGLWFLFDPKMIELMEFEGFPGVGAVFYEVEHMAEGILALHLEHKARKAFKHTNRSMTLAEAQLMLVFCDEILVMSLAMDRLSKLLKDKQTGETKRAEFAAQGLPLLADPESPDVMAALTELVVEARATLFRFMFGVQRADVDVLPGKMGGIFRENLGFRVLHGRGSSDAEQMMFGRTGDTAGIDQSIRGRGVATRMDGTPAEAQLWWTPNVDQHPAMAAGRTPQEQTLLDALWPQAAASLQPGSLKSDPARARILWDPPAECTGAALPAGQHSPTTEAVYGQAGPANDESLHAAETLQPGWVVSLIDTRAGHLRQATVHQATRHGTQVELTVQWADEASPTQLSGYRAGELVEVDPDSIDQ